MSATSLRGTGILLRVAARRDRVLIPVSALALVALVVGSAQATVALYPDAASAMKDLGAVLGSPSALAMYGPATTTSLEGLSIFKTVLMGAVFLAILAYAVVRRHTRAEEEEGRLELVGSGAVGRDAPLAAAVALSTLTVLLTVTLASLGLVAIGFDVVGSLAFGVCWLIAGLFGMAVTAVAAQLTASARGCAAWALGTIGVAYLVRAVGDASTSDAGKALSWISPFGWTSKVAAYGHNRFWLLLPSLALTAALLVLAVALLHRRDLGAGLIASRPGRPRGGATMRSIPGLVWRTGRPTVLGWTIVAAVLGSVVGSLMASVSDMLKSPAVVDMLRKLGGNAGTLMDIYLSTELRFAAAAAAAAGITLALHLAKEERTGRGETVLATATSRPSWFLTHAALALGTTAWVMALSGLAAGLTGSAASADAPGVGASLAAALACVPAAWVCVGVALLLAGSSARYAAYAWAVFAVAFVLGELGSTLRLPTWLIDISPFAHMSQLPGGTFEAGPTIVLTILTVVLTGAGLAAYRRRDAAAA
jgi:ABC-2 type transport system permease protein